MAKTSQERGRTPTVIEFDTPMLERLRREARADQRSVAFLVRKIVKLYFGAIDAQAQEARDRDQRSRSDAQRLTFAETALRDRSTSPVAMQPQARRSEPVMGLLAQEVPEFEVPKS